MHEKFDKHYFRFGKMERDIKTFNKHLNTFDRRFTAVPPDLINQRISSLNADLDALKQQLTNTKTSPSTDVTIVTPIYHRLKDQDDRIDKLDSDHQILIDSLDTLHAKITTTPGRNSNEPTANHSSITTLTAKVVYIQEDNANLDRHITDLYAREREFQQSTLARITISMADFGQLASDNKNLVATVNPKEKLTYPHYTPKPSPRTRES